MYSGLQMDETENSNHWIWGEVCIWRDALSPEVKWSNYELVVMCLSSTGVVNTHVIS